MHTYMYIMYMYLNYYMYTSCESENIRTYMYVHTIYTCELYKIILNNSLMKDVATNN